MATDDKRAALERLAIELLALIDPDPEREGLRETPRRWAEFWMDFTERDHGRCETTFEQRATDQMVVVTGIKVWSLCEHHLLPFWCDVSIGYIAHDKILGLSKFARIARRQASRLQNQERLVEQIAGEIERITGTRDVAVHAQGEHLCMLMRGARSGHTMHSSKMSGVFMSTATARAEFLALANSHGG